MEEPESKDVPRLRKKAKVTVEPITESSESDEELTMSLEGIKMAIYGIQKEMVVDREIWKEVLTVQQEQWELEHKGLEVQWEWRELERRQLEVMHGILGFLSNSAHSQDYMAHMLCDIVKGEVALWTQVVGRVPGKVILGPHASVNISCYKCKNKCVKHLHIVYQPILAEIYLLATYSALAEIISCVLYACRPTYILLHFMHSS